ncbi:hypothetical protein ACFX2F_019311 [Malus domestica]
MASKNVQAVLATNAKNKSVITVGGVISDVTTRSVAIALFAASSTPASTPLKEQEHRRHEPGITLASLRAPKELLPRGSTQSLSFQCRLKQQHSYASHDYRSNFNRGVAGLNECRDRKTHTDCGGERFANRCTRQPTRCEA